MKRQKSIFPALSIVLCCLLFLNSCGKKTANETNFTKVDSLTETYLALQDTTLQAWNTMMHDDNRKLKAMNHLLHKLALTVPEKRDELNILDERLDHLNSLRYDQRTMSDNERVSEYDFASNALVTELISLAESQKEFVYNPTIQKLVDSIRAADQRVNNYRAEYDRVASRFNVFIERHKHSLKELEEDSVLEKKPLFQMALE